MDGADLVGIVETIKDLKETRSQYFCDNQDLRETIEGIKQNIEELKSIHTKNKVIIGEQEALLQTLQREQKTLQHLIETKDIEIVELKSIQRQFDEASRENDSLFKDLTECHNALCKLKELRENHENTLADKDNVITRQQHEIMQVERKVQDYKQNVDCLIEETQTLLKKYNDSKKHLDDLLEEKNQIAQKLHLCEQARQKLEECVHKNQSYVRELKAELNKEQRNNMRIQLKMSALEDELFKAKRDIVRLKEDIVGLNNERNEKHSEVEYCKIELKRKTDEFEEFKKIISRLKQKIMNNRNKNRTCGSTKSGKTRIERNKNSGVRQGSFCMPEKAPARRNRFVGGARPMVSCIGLDPDVRRNRSISRRNSGLDPDVKRSRSLSRRNSGPDPGVRRNRSISRRNSNANKHVGGRGNASFTFQTERREQPNHILGGTKPSESSFQRYKSHGTCGSFIGNNQYLHRKSIFKLKPRCFD